MRVVVLAVARSVRTLAFLSSAAALVIAFVLYDDGVSGTDVFLMLLAIAPPVMLWILWAALRELAELPDRLRRLPESARERRAELERLAAEFREPARRIARLPGTLLRLRALVVAARDLLAPHAPLLPFFSVPFLVAAALAALAAVGEIGIALVLLIAAAL
jgi:hypothetical protein